MASQTIPLSDKHRQAFDVFEQQKATLQAREAAYVAAILDSTDVEVTKQTRVTVTDAGLVVTQPEESAPEPPPNQG